MDDTKRDKILAIREREESKSRNFGSRVFSSIALAEKSIKEHQLQIENDKQLRDTIFQRVADRQINKSLNTKIRSSKALANKYFCGVDERAKYFLNTVDAMTVEQSISVTRETWHSFSNNLRDTIKSKLTDVNYQLEVLYALIDFKYPIWLNEYISLPDNANFQMAVINCNKLLKCDFLSDEEQCFLNTMRDKYHKLLLETVDVDITPVNEVMLKRIYLNYDIPDIFNRQAEMLKRLNFKRGSGRIPNLYKNALILVLYKILSKAMEGTDEDIYEVERRILIEALGVDISPKTIKDLRHK